MQLLQDEIVARREKLFEEIIGDKYRSLAGEVHFADMSQAEQEETLKKIGLMPCIALFLIDKLSQGNICSVHMLVRAHLAYEKKRKLMHDRN